ncbi:MAG: thioredoxin-like negative regulator of GroEL [Colwellia sp.]|jgi:thioredoxin-like negative regulator of GroEL
MNKDINLRHLNWCEHKKKQILFYFSISWCTPCKTMTALIDAISDHYLEYLKVVNIDVDE